MVLMRAQAVLITRTDKTQWYHFLLAIGLPYMLNGAFRFYCRSSSRICENEKFGELATTVTASFFQQ